MAKQANKGKKSSNNQKCKRIIPKDTKLLMRKKKVDNAYLEYHRYIEVEGDYRPKKPQKSDLSSHLLNRAHQQNEKIITEFKQKISLTYTPTTKLMLNTGGISPYSNHSLTALHALYSVPYIPSTALKGVIRSCFIDKKCNGEEAEALKHNLFIKCFGKSADQSDDKEGKGKLIFLDAFPREVTDLTEDIQTVHYKQYYETEGRIAPTDDQSTVPLQYTAVQNMDFFIVIGVLDDAFSQNEYEQMREIVRLALTEYGIGAKTAIGYGIGKVTFGQCCF